MRAKLALLTNIHGNHQTTSWECSRWSNLIIGVTGCYYIGRFFKGGWFVRGFNSSHKARHDKTRKSSFIIAQLLWYFDCLFIFHFLRISHRHLFKFPDIHVTFKWNLKFGRSVCGFRIIKKKKVFLFCFVDAVLQHLEKGNTKTNIINRLQFVGFLKSHQHPSTDGFFSLCVCFVAYEWYEKNKINKSSIEWHWNYLDFPKVMPTMHACQF